MKLNFDIDIDFFDRTQILNLIPHAVASRVENGVRKRHNTGIYLQNIPVDPLEHMATIDYRTAESRGYFKLDFLNVSAYQGVRDEDHLVKLMNTEPIWELLEEQDICSQLFHINEHCGLIKRLKPKSVLELATVLALIRPGCRHLISDCATNGFESIQDQVWSQSTDGYTFRKSHGICYAYVIIVQLNLICESALDQNQKVVPEPMYE